MIKILFFIENMSEGGAEKVLRDLVNNMDRSRFEITVQTVWPCDASRYLVSGIRYKSMYASHSKFNQLRYRLEAESGLAYRLHIKDDYDIECAYLEMGPTKVISASTNKKSKKLAWVHCDLTKHVTDLNSFTKKTTNWYAKYDKIVCVSQNVKDRFDEIFHNKFDSCVLYNVIDDEAIRNKSREQLANGMEKQRFTVLSVGRLSYQKNYLRLLRTHKRLLDNGFLHDLWILGDGPERPKLERFICDNNLYDSVKMPGFIANPYPFMREADMLVCSSNYEGYSTFMTEGVILGRPIVATDVSGMRELLGDSKYGLIVKNDDEDFYQGIKTLLENAAVRERFAKLAEERGKSFSSKSLAEKTERFFEELTNK